MAFKSEAQRKKFQELYKQGKVTRSVVDEWEKKTAGKKLPERVKPKALKK